MILFLGMERNCPPKVISYQGKPELGCELFSILLVDS